MATHGHVVGVAGNAEAHDWHLVSEDTCRLLPVTATLLGLELEVYAILRAVGTAVCSHAGPSCAHAISLSHVNVVARRTPIAALASHRLGYDGFHPTRNLQYLTLNVDVTALQLLQDQVP